MHTCILLFGLAKMQATSSPTQASERYDASPGLASVYYTCTVPDPTRETARDSVSSTYRCLLANSQSVRYPAVVLPLQQVIPMCMCMDKVHPVAAVVY
jgi:hypothetical protein